MIGGRSIFAPIAAAAERLAARAFFCQNQLLTRVRILYSTYYLYVS
jgi:hypothetical protein